MLPFVALYFLCWFYKVLCCCLLCYVVCYSMLICCAFEYFYVVSCLRYVGLGCFGVWDVVLCCFHVGPMLFDVVVYCLCYYFLVLFCFACRYLGLCHVVLRCVVFVFLIDLMWYYANF